MLTGIWNRIKAIPKKVISLHSPATTFSHATVGLVAITQSKDDWQSLFGMIVGAKIFIVAKWVGAYCIAVTTAGRSVIPSVDNPAPPTPPPPGSGPP